MTSAAYTSKGEKGTCPSRSKSLPDEITVWSEAVTCTTAPNSETEYSSSETEEEQKEELSMKGAHNETSSLSSVTEEDLESSKKRESSSESSESEGEEGKPSSKRGPVATTTRTDNQSSSQSSETEDDPVSNKKRESASSGSEEEEEERKPSAAKPAKGTGTDSSWMCCAGLDGNRDGCDVVNCSGTLAGSKCEGGQPADGLQIKIPSTTTKFEINSETEDDPESNKKRESASSGSEEEEEEEEERKPSAAKPAKGTGTDNQSSQRKPSIKRKFEIIKAQNEESNSETSHEDELERKKERTSSTDRGKVAEGGPATNKRKHEDLKTWRETRKELLVALQQHLEILERRGQSSSVVPSYLRHFPPKEPGDVEEDPSASSSKMAVCNARPTRDQYYQGLAMMRQEEDHDDSSVASWCSDDSELSNEGDTSTACGKKVPPDSEVSSSKEGGTSTASSSKKKVRFLGIQNCS